MLISNFNLYKNEWLDLVFDKRNKEYGAYDIREHYTQNLAKALAVSVVTVVGAALIVGSAITAKPSNVRIVEVNTIHLVDPPKPKIDPVKPKIAVAPPAKASSPVRTRKFVTPVPTPGPVTEEMPNQDELSKTAVGPATTEGKSGENVDPNPDPGPGTGPGTEVIEDNTPHIMAELSILPKPFGGDEGWSKFLHKNLRYPQQAVEEEKSGKVWISFIIEKDGSLTDIKVLRGPGYGMNEEAMRVLKLAPAWKPGMQNGHAVRVQYTLPISFALE